MARAVGPIACMQHASRSDQQSDSASVGATPGYGGGMSSAKAALESDTRVLAFEAGRKYSIRVNTISAGPLGSRAAKAIGFIDDMIRRAPARDDVHSPGVLAAPTHDLQGQQVKASPTCGWLHAHKIDAMGRSRPQMLVWNSFPQRLKLDGAPPCRYSYENAPIQKELQAREVGNAAAFLLSPLASAVTGSTLYVDNGLNAMGLAVDSQTLARKEEPVSA